MILIGQNNHGKSNVLSSILFFFGEIKPQDMDFNNNAQELSVEITFSDLDEADKSTFKKYLTFDNKITVKKSAYLGGAFEYRGYIQNPIDEWLRESNASSLTKRDEAEKYPLYSLLPDSGRILKQDVIHAQNKFILQNEHNLKFTYELEESNFLGLKSVAKGIFGDLYFVPAVKDVSDDFSPKETSAFGRLYADIIETMSEKNTEWMQTKKKLSDLFNSLNKSDSNGNQNTNRPLELTKFEAQLSTELKLWGAEIDVEVVPPNIDDVFKANTQIWVNDGMKTDIKRKGHGLQRAITFALIKVISDKLRASRSNPPKEGESSRTVSASTYFILEEPELYLHPQAQRALFDSLINLSESNNQVILCTHSSSLIDVERYKSICIIKKEAENTGTQVHQCLEDLFTGDNKKDFNLTYWINPDRGELFFAKKVILVEGPTEKTIIPRLAKNLDIFRHDYTLVDCGSKNSIPLYCVLLNKFKIPYIAVYDKDHQSSKNCDAIDSANKSTKLVQDAIDTTIGSSVVFENDIEEELGMIAGDKNKPYVALKEVSSDSFQISESLRKKITRIYA